MKIKHEYILEYIGGKYVVVNTNSKSLNFNKILALNETSKLLWQALEKDTNKDELVKILIDNYQIGKDKAVDDVNMFIDELNKLECIEYE